MHVIFIRKEKEKKWKKKKEKNKKKEEKREQKTTQIVEMKWNESTSKGYVKSRRTNIDKSAIRRKRKILKQIIMEDNK